MIKRIQLPALLLLTFIFCLSEQVFAASVEPRILFARDKEDIIGCLSLKLPAGYHAYAHDPGEAGRPTSLTFTIGGGAPVPVFYPQGALQRDYYDPDVTVKVYEGTVRLFMKLPKGSEGAAYHALLSQLLCSSSNCMPVDTNLNGTVPKVLPPLEREPWHQEWTEIRSQASHTPDEAQIGTSQPFGSADEPASKPGRDNMAQSSSNLPVQPAPYASADANDNESSPLPPPPDFSIQLEPVYENTALEIFSLSKALLLGILAGLLLNAMPCVLPVLTFKVTGLLMTSTDSKAGLAQFRTHNIYFVAGILTLFTILAVVLGAADLMWGQLYQSQEFLLVMLLLIFLMGLSMLGVFTLPVFDFKAFTRTKNPRLQAYLTGLVSTILATPCSGPLLGGVLGWAFTQPLPVLIVVFWSVGVGMSVPYIFLSIFPKFANALPRPGAWMQVFEHIVGFLIMGTCLYLLSILPERMHMQVLSALLIVALAAFLLGQFCGVNAPRFRRHIGGVLFTAMLLGAVFFALRPPAPEAVWKTFQPHEFVQSLGNKAMLVEFTADWCPNCKFMEATVFTEKRLSMLQQKYNLEFVRVDLTDANAYGIKLLGLLGSRSIPLTALFPAGEGASRPLVLRDVFSATSLEHAAKKVFQP